MKEEKTTLYIGAHEDDVAIGAGITIKRKPQKAHILTITDGVIPKTKCPIIIPGFKFKNESEYREIRLKEDKKALMFLGVDISERYNNTQIPDQQSYLYIKQIVENIERLTKKQQIKRIVTHSFPEAHPDHEIVSLCSHLVSQRLDIEIWEYPLYRINKNKKSGYKTFPEENESEKFVIGLSEKEIRAKKQLLEIYQTQDFIVKKFMSSKEKFRKIKINFNHLTDSTYYYGTEKGKPIPEEVRKAFKKFLILGNASLKLG